MERLLGELTEFKRQTSLTLEHLERQQEEILTKIASLDRFKWQLIGGSCAVSVVVSLSIEFYHVLAH